jgi:hypothetical protein
MYQMAICLAARAPFLGRSVECDGAVVLFDFENGIGDSDRLIESICAFLKLDSPPNDLFVWNQNDCHQDYGSQGRGLFDMIQDVKPAFCIIDSLASYDPDAEEKNKSAARLFNNLRKLIRSCGTSFLLTHHRKKPAEKQGEAPICLVDETNVRRWFRQARGASAIVNSSDVRLGVEEGPLASKGDNPGLVLRGFGRTRGEVGPVHLVRVLDSDGEPLGFRSMNRIELLFNSEQEAAFHDLPAAFSFKEAKLKYGRSDQPTKDFLDKCVQLGALRQPCRGRYEKVGIAE